MKTRSVPFFAGCGTKTPTVSRHEPRDPARPAPEFLADLGNRVLGTTGENVRRRIATPRKTSEETRRKREATEERQHRSPVVKFSAAKRGWEEPRCSHKWRGVESGRASLLEHVSDHLDRVGKARERHSLLRIPVPAKRRRPGEACQGFRSTFQHGATRQA